MSLLGFDSEIFQSKNTLKNNDNKKLIKRFNFQSTLNLYKS